jgi:type II secretory pathway predicted ATPase ExeA
LKICASTPRLRQAANRWALRFARTALTENDQFCRMKIQIFDTPTFTALTKIRLILDDFDQKKQNRNENWTISTKTREFQKPKINILRYE